MHALWILRRTGKTTLLLQAIQKLLEQGVAAERIGYFTGMKGDSFDFHFPEKLRQIAGAKVLDENKPLFGELLEAAVVSEYHQSHITADIYFAHTYCPPGSSDVWEIDLIDLEQKHAYEVKLTDGHGYKGFNHLSGLPELQGFSFTLLRADNYVQEIYAWGRSLYRKSDTIEQ